VQDLSCLLLSPKRSFNQVILVLTVCQLPGEGTVAELVARIRVTYISANRAELADNPRFVGFTGGH
jgi:hypothetical protein